MKKPHCARILAISLEVLAPGPRLFNEVPEEEDIIFELDAAVAAIINEYLRR